MTTHDPAAHQRRNGLALASMLTGLVGGVGLSAILGILALVQIRRRGGRGRGFAVVGIALSVVWALAFAAGLSWLVTEVKKDLNGSREVADQSPGARQGLQAYPLPGECFDEPADESVAEIEIIDCSRPHEAQMILSYRMPSGPWPGGQEIEERSFRGCEERLDAWSRRREDARRLGVYALFPTRVTWWAGDRTVRCALMGDGRLTRPIDMSPPPANVREWSELKPRDCISFPHPKGVWTVRLVDCRAPHTAQVTHVFALRYGTWPGDSAADEQASDGCVRRWDAAFARRPSPVSIEQWYSNPDKDSWALGDRSVTCYVTAKKGKLTRSVM